MHTKTPGRLLAVAALACCWVACAKDDTPTPNPQTNYTVTLRNDYNLLQARYAAFLSDADGNVRAFRWLPGEDTAQLVAPGIKTSDRLDCTIVRVSTVLAPGTGVRDTSVVLQTYTQVASGARVLLRDPAFVRYTDVQLTLTNIQSLDSIAVPDGLTFTRPEPGNNFTGRYRVWHTGRLWLRLRADGEPNWRYAVLDNINGPEYAAVLDVKAMGALPSSPISVGLPFLANWTFTLDRIVDTAQRQFLSLGSMVPVPGAPVPFFDRLLVADPPGLTPAGYRLRVQGTDPTPGSFGIISDRFYFQLPAGLSAPAFDVHPTILADNRLVAVQCTGNFDALTFTRVRAGTPNLQWNVLLPPLTTGFVTYRLPDVPPALADLFAPLKNYDFGGQVRVRAEAYDRLDNYEEVLGSYLWPADPLWRPRAGYAGKERVF